MLTLPVLYFASPGLLRASVHHCRPHRILMDPLVVFFPPFFFFAYLHILCHYTTTLIHVTVLVCNPSLPRVCLCVLLCVPALLLNNPGYHVVLSADRNGSRPLVASSRAPAQEKSLNVPQGKRPQSGPGESGTLAALACNHGAHFACA